MKKFVLRVLLFSSVLLVLAVVMECMLRHVPNMYAFKRHLMEDEGRNIRTLALGSSVVASGIAPDCFPEGTYNLGVSGQWLRFHVQMFEKYQADMPDVERVVLGMCYHALWSDDTFDQFSVAAHDIYLGLHVEHDWLPRSELLSIGGRSLRKWSKYYLLGGQTMLCDSLGLDHSFDAEGRPADWREKALKNVAGHNALAQAEDRRGVYADNVRRIHRLAQLCRERGAELWIVVTPVTGVYYAGIDPESLKVFRNTLAEVAAESDHVRLLYYLDDRRFTDDDFYDGNHLSSDVGAPKFSRILRQDMGL